MRVLSGNRVSVTWKNRIRTSRFVSHTGDPRTPSEKGSLNFYFYFSFPTNLGKIILIVLLKGHSHAIWQLCKKQEGVLASIEFQNE